MVSPYQLEELENIRRICERGRDIAVSHYDTKLTDVFQHILDILERVTSEQR